MLGVLARPHDHQPGSRHVLRNLLLPVTADVDSRRPDRAQPLPRPAAGDELAERGQPVIEALLLTDVYNQRQEAERQPPPFRPDQVRQGSGGGAHPQLQDIPHVEFERAQVKKQHFRRLARWPPRRANRRQAEDHRPQEELDSAQGRDDTEAPGGHAGQGEPEHFPAREVHADDAGEDDQQAGALEETPLSDVLKDAHVCQPNPGVNNAFCLTRGTSESSPPIAPGRRRRGARRHPAPTHRTSGCQFCRL
jgi:hypothetical protein